MSKQAQPKPLLPERSQQGARSPSPARGMAGRAHPATHPGDVEVAATSDLGSSRPLNEDYAGFYAPADAGQRERKGVLCLVADGMGGHQAGEVASQGAVESAMAYYYDDPAPDTGGSLARAFQAANQRIYDQARSDPSKAGMGTTLVAGAILGRKVYLANVGDSRAYRVTATGVEQLTTDHSWVEQQVRAGLLTPEQALVHPQRSLVTRALGTRAAVEVDLFEAQLGEGDVLVLCTDGLTGRVADAEIAALVRAHPPQEAGRRLVALANERGGPDNITVLIARDRATGRAVAAPGPHHPVGAGREPPRRFPLLAILLAGAVLLVVALGTLLLFPSVRPRGTQPQATVVPALSRPATLDTPSPGPLPDLAATEAPAPAVEGGAQPAPTLGPGSTATDRATPQAPTATLAATYTPLPSTPTPPPETAEPVPTNSAPTALPSPTPVLGEPAADAQLQGSVTFRWTGAPTSAGQGYQVLVWKEGATDHNGAAGFTTLQQQTIDLNGVPQIQAGGSGVYLWSVVVVDLDSEERLSPEAPPRRFTFTARQPGLPPATEPPPTPPRQGAQDGS